MKWRLNLKNACLAPFLSFPSSFLLSSFILVPIHSTCLLLLFTVFHSSLINMSYTPPDPAAQAYLLLTLDNVRVTQVSDPDSSSRSSLTFSNRYMQVVKQILRVANWCKSSVFCLS